MKQQGSTNDELTNFNFLDRLCIGAYSLCVYLYKLVIPYPMSPLYPYPKPLPIWVYLAPIGFAAMLYGLWRAWKNDSRIWVVGSLFFFFNIMFLLQVLGAGQGFLAWIVLAARSIFRFFFAILAWLYEKYSKQEGIGKMIPVILGVWSAYAVWTVKQIGIWKNGETLWTYMS
ncbi:MAG: hypothetical protein R2778_09495 [Saprospiraceae bacterium]